MRASSRTGNQQPHYLSSRMQYLRENFIHPPFDYEFELMEAIRLGDENRAMDMLRKINELEAAVLAVYPLRSKKNALIASCTLYTRAIIRGASIRKLPSISAIPSYWKSKKSPTSSG